MEIEKAFKEYREAMVRAMISFSGDEEAARDGVSQAFTKALINKLMLEAMPEPAMKSWLYAVARNAIVDIKRRENLFRRFTMESADLELVDPHFSAWAEQDPAERITVELLLEKLPESLRIPVELKYYKGMNASEIGEAMKLPAATVRTRLRTAMLRLRKKF
ncbi:MAG: sigma-70 family RNA polymerase sigma factor [Treponema sp.]|nr:sigma-70 family RNA polymerase sigma factor [Treponema sp.]